MGTGFTRRALLKSMSAGSLYALGGLAMPTLARTDETVDQSLLEAIEASDGTRATALLATSIRQGDDPWKIHLSLFPVVQRVVNPPFINPHLPKMYAIYRELVPHLDQSKIAAFVSLEVREYTRRPKTEKIPKADKVASRVSFDEIETAIGKNDPQRTASLMAALLNREGGEEFARRMLLLGSGYLNNSLGHSVSCTAFILLEILQRRDQDPWPALSALASYFCKGRFQKTPPLRKSTESLEKTAGRHLLRATSGRGIINLHHTITRYAIERVRTLLSQADYDHMLNAWIEFMGGKREERATLEGVESGPLEDYSRFYKDFSMLKAKPVAASLISGLGSEEGRRRAGRFLAQAVCDKYQGNYDPHFVNGLGSALWVLNQYWQDTPLVATALFQYLDYFFDGLK